MDVRVGLWRKLSAKESMLLSYGSGEDSSLGLQGVKLVSPEGNQFWILNGRTDAKAEAPVLWPPDVKNWLIGKDPDDGRDWGQEEQGITEDEMAGWHPPTRWMWVWVNSGSWWWTWSPDMPGFMGSQRVRHDWATELNWSQLQHGECTEIMNHTNMFWKYYTFGIIWTLIEYVMVSQNYCYFLLCYWYGYFQVPYEIVMDRII